MSAETLPHDLVGLAIVVFLLGVKHGFDADHLATIDGLTRAAGVARPRAARTCGALFSLGHGAVVVVVALTIAHATAAWQVPAWLADVGAGVSIAFLAALGLMNIASVLRTPADAVVMPTGLRSVWLRRITGGAGGAWSGHPLWALPIGALFAVSFDTISQAALFATAASRTASWQGALGCALLFTLGMLFTDGLNGLWIAKLLRRDNPIAPRASRIMGLGVGGASLLIATAGALRLASPAADRWLDDRAWLLSVAVFAIVLLAFLATPWLAGGRDRRPAVSQAHAATVGLGD
jgi:high-affinity nickel-transport protein